MGYLPEDLAIFLRRPIKVSRKYGCDSTETVLPAFICDDARPNTHQTARTWASISTQDDDSIIRRPNEPFEGLRIFNLESRGQGGRAYKVINSEGHYYDLREDDFMYAMLNGYVGHNGELAGQWVWVRNQNHMYLTCVGSPRYLEALGDMMETIKAEEAPTLSAKDLVIGGVYALPQSLDNLFIYIGRARYQKKLMYMWCVTRRVATDFVTQFLNGHIMYEGTPQIFLTTYHNKKYSEVTTLDIPHMPPNYTFQSWCGYKRFIFSEVTLVTSPPPYPLGG